MLLFSGMTFAQETEQQDTTKKVDSVTIVMPVQLQDTIPADTVVPVVKKDTLTFIGVGDIMMGTNYPSKSYLPPNDKNLLKPVEDILKDADVTFGNHEGTLLDEGGRVKSCKNPKYCYAFRSPEKYAEYLVQAGFDVVSIANNHLGDFGNTGRESTVNTLERNGLHYAGLLKYPTDTFTIDGVKYGFCAFAPNSGTVNIRNIQNAQNIVRSLDSIVDIVIVSFHGGGEGTDYRHVKNKTEYYIGENRGNVYDFSHKMIDAGADIIFGHGPHITRGIEVYKDRFIAYSLGNFCTYGRFSLSGLKGIAPIVKVYTDNEGKFLKGKIYSIKQVGRGGPVLDENNKALIELKKLTKADFPNTPIEIDDQGNVSRKDD